MISLLNLLSLIGLCVGLHAGKNYAQMPAMLVVGMSLYLCILNDVQAAVFEKSERRSVFCIVIDS